MSIQATGWVFEQELPARPKLVLLALANHADHRTGYCWLKTETIAAEAACSPRAVFNFVGALIRNGFVRKELRRGDDGKQRATDYWILFNREPAKWISAANESEEPDADAQDVVEPVAPGACGENEPPARAAPPEIPARACGPVAPACHHKDSAEPSKTNPEEESRPSPFAAAPRSYRPPPLAPEPPQGDIGDPQAKKIFVFEGTRAWQAWLDSRRAAGQVASLPTTTRVVDGRSRRGWYLPSLFPPGTPKATTDPPAISSDDADILANSIT